ncbi:hypothetical protein SKAU_G00193470 [Synaphobranchus kaupii]|uniref:Uncharacterized protein n=1 Tax=Synaphobranchus kaupii TaxID=118154 RepID=A0A9Q1FDX6_SYNKA|nr:hypothetical protein SKAU_G00193470 [Synaphobranchus kaupii]
MRLPCCCCCWALDFLPVLRLRGYPLIWDPCNAGQCILCFLLKCQSSALPCVPGSRVYPSCPCLRFSALVVLVGGIFLHVWCCSIIWLFHIYPFDL